jgi:glutathione S-transferase
MKLYWALLSPFVRKVMVVAHETATVHRLELAETSVSMAEANTALQLDNPLSKIPTLVLGDGSALYDSRVICEYLDSLNEGPRLFPAGDARWDALRRQALADGLMDALILWRQERLKPAERQTADWMTTFADKVTRTLRQLEGEAATSAALPFDIGHAATGCALGYLDVRFADLDWRADAPQLAAWHLTFEARPSADATRAKLAS